MIGKYHRVDLSLVSSLIGTSFFSSLWDYVRTRSTIPNGLESPPAQFTLKVFGCACDLMTDFSSIEVALGHLREPVKAYSVNGVHGAKIQYHMIAFDTVLERIFQDSSALTAAVLQLGLPEAHVSNVVEMQLPSLVAGYLWSIRKARESKRPRNFELYDRYHLRHGKEYAARYQGLEHDLARAATWGGLDARWARVLEGDFDAHRGTAMWKNRIGARYDALALTADHVRRDVKMLFAELYGPWRDAAFSPKLPTFSEPNPGEGHVANGDCVSFDDEAVPF